MTYGLTSWSCQPTNVSRDKRAGLELGLELDMGRLLHLLHTDKLGKRELSKDAIAMPITSVRLDHPVPLDFLENQDMMVFLAKTASPAKMPRIPKL